MIAKFPMMFASAVLMTSPALAFQDEMADADMKSEAGMMKDDAMMKDGGDMQEDAKMKAGSDMKSDNMSEDGMMADAE